MTYERQDQSKELAEVMRRKRDLGNLVIWTDSETKTAAAVILPFGKSGRGVGKREKKRDRQIKSIRVASIKEVLV